MSKVLILKGLPASGKSTFAKKLVSGDIRALGNNWVRVNKDEFRATLHNSKWSKERENHVIELRDFVISKELLRGHNVVIDDTNFNPKHEQAIKSIVEAYNRQNYKNKATVEVMYFNTPLEVCIERNKERNKLLKAAKQPVIVTDGIIRDMYEREVKDKTITYDVLQKYKPEAVKISDLENREATDKYVAPKGLPKALIVDIDGTLAHMTGRSPFDWKNVHTDIKDEEVADIVDTYHRKGDMILIMSGRDGGCREITEKWLSENGITFNYLFMRTAGDNRKDSIVKRELFDKYIRDKFDIRFVLDDRNQVVDMWRNELGLKVLQVADGDF